MILERDKTSLRDFSGRGNDVDLEVNWNNHVNECKYVKLKMRDDEAIIKKEHLWAALFSYSEEDKQEKMIPIVQVPVRHHRTIVTVAARADLKKGQLFQLPMTISTDLRTGKMVVKP